MSFFTGCCTQFPCFFKWIIPACFPSFSICIPCNSPPVLTPFLEAVITSWPSTHSPSWPPGPTLMSRGKYFYSLALLHTYLYLIPRMCYGVCVLSLCFCIGIVSPVSCGDKTFWATFNSPVPSLEMKLWTKS